MAYGTLKSDVIQSSTAGTPPQFNDGNGTQTGVLCRAWVNFDGISGSVAIRGSFNVSSITYVNTGQYTLNFTAPLPDTTYSIVGNARSTSAGSILITPAPDNLVTTSSIRVLSFVSNTGSLSDATYVFAAVFR